MLCSLALAIIVQSGVIQLSNHPRIKRMVVGSLQNRILIVELSFKWYNEDVLRYNI
jgi:hypothetical protein